MPPKYSIARKTRISYLVYSHAIDENPGATHEYISSWVSDKNKLWLQTLNWKAPSESRSRDYIRKILSSRTWMDSEWHLGGFAANRAHALDISPESIPDVFVVALRAFAGGKRLTIRQAWWVSRLIPILGSVESSTESEVENIYSLAAAYAANESAGAALQNQSGLKERNLPGIYDSDTWPLDVLLAQESSVLLSEPGLYDVLQEAGFLAETKWPENIRLESTPTSVEVAPLLALLLKASPELSCSCKAMTSALLWLRAYAEQQVEYGAESGESAFEETTKPAQLCKGTRSAPEWDSLSDDEKLAKAREIGTQVMRLIDRQKAEKQKGIENDE
jgi:hypothetical protein